MIILLLRGSCGLRPPGSDVITDQRAVKVAFHTLSGHFCRRIALYEYISVQFLLLVCFFFIRVNKEKRTDCSLLGKKCPFQFSMLSD